jgi:hypothetical protein
VRKASPNVGSVGNDLSGVGGTSASNVYAVGETSTSTGSDVLVEHWNGSRWSVVTAKNPGSADNELNAVFAESSTNIWAVGSFNNGIRTGTLIERCR